MDRHSYRRFEPGQDVATWLQRMSRSSSLNGWTDQIALASEDLGQVAYRGFRAIFDDNTTLAHFVEGLQRRFGPDKQNMLVRIAHRSRKKMTAFSHTVMTCTCCLHSQSTQESCVEMYC